MRLFHAILVSCILASAAVSPHIAFSNAQAQSAPPPNAQARLVGGGWECVHGYRRVGERCIPIPVPVNASLTLNGNTWRCNHGYEREADRCRRLVVPANARLSFDGHSWQCVDGWQRQDGRCFLPDRPEQTGPAAPTDVCRRGFRLSAGGRCTRFTPPRNAGYDATGHEWICLAGYTREGDGCRAMNAIEKAAHALLLEELVTQDLALIARECRPVLREQLYGGLSCSGERTSHLENRCAVTVDARSGQTRLLCAGEELKPLTNFCRVSLTGAGALDCTDQQGALAAALPAAE